MPNRKSDPRKGLNEKTRRTLRRHTPVPRSTASSGAELTGERLERLKDRVAKFNANIEAIRASVGKG